MSDILRETVIGPAEAAGLLRCGPDAVGQLIRDGDGGARLEGAESAAGWVTSVEAVYRFANRRPGKHRGRAAAFGG
jgi:hypothetical protein